MRRTTITVEMKEAWRAAGEAVSAASEDAPADQPDQPAWQVQMGKADWIYDEDIDCHIPACTHRYGLTGTFRCGNGPLTGDEIATGLCSEPHC